MPPNMLTDKTIGDLTTSLQTITPPRVAAAVVPIDGSHQAFEVEAQAVRHALSSRQNEFTAGRAAARGAMAALGAPPVAIPRAEDRRPLWPTGIVGSISHTQGCAAAAVGLSADIHGLGLDIEEKSPLKSALRRKILTAPELAQRDAHPMVGRAPRCKLTFVTKEALFKSIYPITGQFFGFQEAKVSLSEDGTWQADFVREAIGLPLDLETREGRWELVDNVLVAVICVVQRGSSK